jgi:hypothetical protein
MSRAKHGRKWAEFNLINAPTTSSVTHQDRRSHRIRSIRSIFAGLRRYRGRRQDRVGLALGGMVTLELARRRQDHA